MTRALKCINEIYADMEFMRNLKHYLSTDFIIVFIVPFLLTFDSKLSLLSL